MHSSEWRGSVVNTVAITFQIVGETVTKPVVFVSRIRQNSGFYNLGCQRSGSYFASFHWTNVPGNVVSIKMGSLHICLSPSAFEGIEILVFKHRLIQRLL